MYIGQMLVSQITNRLPVLYLYSKRPEQLGLIITIGVRRIFD